MTTLGKRVVIAGEHAADREAGIRHLVEDRGFAQFDGDGATFPQLAHYSVVMESDKPSGDLQHLFETGGVLIWISRHRDMQALENYLAEAGINPVDALGRAGYFLRSEQDDPHQLHTAIENIVDQLEV